MNPSIAHLLRTDSQVPECHDVATWWPRWRDGPARLADPVAQALRGGFAADRVGWAFAAGYQAALRRLVPTLPADTLAALCVTEDGGNRPRDIRTRLQATAEGHWTVTGQKRWTTLGPASQCLLVVAALPGDDAARPRLQVARVAAGTPGLRLEPMPDTPFVPEVPHARVHLDAVPVDRDDLLPGDGYDDVVKPFRTIEDAHVTLAVLAYLLREARERDWPAALAEQVTAALVLLGDLAAEPADAPATHVALAGALQLAHGLYEAAGAQWARQADDPAARRWRRDAALFGVAGQARTLRAQRAWQRLHG